MATSTGKPYKDTPLDSNRFIRKFYESVESNELIWHRDKRTREIQVLEGEGWMFQHDNSLPFVLEKNKTYTVDAETYHRLIKGKGNLILEIKEE